MQSLIELFNKILSLIESYIAKAKRSQYVEDVSNIKSDTLAELGNESARVRDIAEFDLSEPDDLHKTDNN